MDMSMLAIPKPGNRRKPEVKKDGRLVLSRAKWDKQRALLCERADEYCEECGFRTPLKYGHAHHIDRRGLGGGKRDDGLDNLRWLCEDCHAEEHKGSKRPERKG